MKATTSRLSQSAGEEGRHFPFSIFHFSFFIWSFF